MSDTSNGLPFEVTQGAPTRVTLTGEDGAKYTVAVQLSVLRVDQHVGKRDPAGNPVFNITATLALGPTEAHS